MCFGVGCLMCVWGFDVVFVLLVLLVLLVY